MHFLVQYAIISCVTLLLGRLYLNRRSQLKPPPGPKGLPLVGNILDLPGRGTLEYQHWLTHKGKYGPISSVTVLGQTLVILHTRDAIHDVLDVQSAKTSGRPTPEFAHNICGFDKIPGGQQYNDKYRRCRKMIHAQLGSKSMVHKFNNVQEMEIHKFLARILDHPDNFLQHLKSLTSAIILKVTYGYTVDSSTPDPLVKLIEQWISNFSQATVPFSFLVDIFPVLKHLPDWAPGAGFKKIGRAWAKNNSAAGNIPYLFAKERVESGSFTPSYVSTALQQNLVDDSRSEVSASEYEEQIIWTAANLYAGGSDTTVSSVHSFLLAMVLNPEVQRKAQDDIANVVGTDRLPCFEDRKSLPFIDALVTEIHRWFPVGPMGLPHRADEAVVYNSYQIPKGAYILPAVWSVLHDPETYSNPHEFDPSRYLEPRAEPDPRIFSFGAGRRICPGRFFADNTIFLTVAGILAVCTIRKAVDSQGNEVEVALQPTPGTVSKPTPFLYKIETRNPKLSELVRNLEVEQSSRGDIVGLMEKFGVS